MTIQFSEVVETILVDEKPVSRRFLSWEKFAKIYGSTITELVKRDMTLTIDSPNSTINPNHSRKIRLGKYV